MIQISDSNCAVTSGVLAGHVGRPLPISCVHLDIRIYTPLLVPVLDHPRRLRASNDSCSLFASQASLVGTCWSDPGARGHFLVLSRFASGTAMPSLVLVQDHCEDGISSVLLFVLAQAFIHFTSQIIDGLAAGEVKKDARSDDEDDP